MSFYRATSEQEEDHKWTRNLPLRRRREWWQSKKGSTSLDRERETEGLGALAAPRRESLYQVTCLSSKQNVYGLPFDNSNERLVEDKLQCICSGINCDMLWCPLDQESNDAESDNLKN